jgi:hypothetical protein
VSLVAPRARRLVLRLRLPGGRRIASVTLGGLPYRRFDPASETIDLTGRSGALELVVGTRGRKQ